MRLCQLQRKRNDIPYVSVGIVVAVLQMLFMPNGAQRISFSLTVNAVACVLAHPFFFVSFRTNLLTARAYMTFVCWALSSSVCSKNIYVTNQQTREERIFFLNKSISVCTASGKKRTFFACTLNDGIKKHRPQNKTEEKNNRFVRFVNVNSVKEIS